MVGQQVCRLQDSKHKDGHIQCTLQAQVVWCGAVIGDESMMSQCAAS